jgi:hypothetical protein
VATFTERIQLLLTSNATDAISGLRATGLASKGLDGQLENTQGVMGKLGAVTGMTAGQMKASMGTAAVVAGVAVAKFAADSVQQFTNLATKVRDFSRASGATADASSRLVAVFDDLEISQQAADRGFFLLNRGIAEGTVNLKDYGAEAVRSKDGNLDIYKTLLSISEAYNSTEDSGERAALVQDAFGRGGKELIPILERGKQGIQELYGSVPDGQLLSQEDVDRARELDLAMDDLKDSVQEVQIELGREMVPVLTDTANALALTIRGANDFKAGLDDLGLGKVIGAVERTINPVSALGGAVKDLGGVFGFGGGESDKFGDSQKRLAEAQKEVTKVFADNTSSAKEKAAAQRELSAAENEYEGVLKRVNKGLADNTSKLLENMAAGQEYTNAQLGVAGAQLNVEAATTRYTETLAENGDGALETRQSALALEQSYVALGQATYDAAVAAGRTKEAAAEQVNALNYVAGTLSPGSPLRVWLEEYISRLQNGIPKTVTTRLTIQQALEGFLSDAPPGYSQGGWVGGSGNADTVPAMLTPGEFVVSKAMLAGRAAMPASVSGGGAQVIQLVVSGRVLAEVTAAELNRAGGPKIAQRAIA